MIRFVIKSAFFLGLIAMVLPGGQTRDGEPEINLFAMLYGAQAAVSDLSTFCERAPSACAAGGDVARFAGDRMSDGLALAYKFVDGAVSKDRTGERVETSARIVPAADPLLAGRTAMPSSARRAVAPSDYVTTAAIPGTEIPATAIRRDHPASIALPTPRPQFRLAADLMPKANALPTRQSRSSPTPSRRVAQSVPVPAAAPRG